MWSPHLQCGYQVGLTPTCSTKWAGDVMVAYLDGIEVDGFESRRVHTTVHT